MGVVVSPHHLPSPSSSLFPPMFSWASARLLALLLNSLSGLFQHLEREGREQQLKLNIAEMNMNSSVGGAEGMLDTLIGMRVIMDNLLSLDRHFRDRNIHPYHPAIFQEIGNLSGKIEQLLEEAKERTRKRMGKEQFEKLAQLFIAREGAKLEEHKLVDETLRWAEKELKERRAKEEEMEAGGSSRGRGEELWIGQNGPEIMCLSSVLSNCSFIAECATFLSDRGRVGIVGVRQLWLFQLISDSLQKCPISSPLPSLLANSSTFVAERCVNMLDELHFLTKGNSGRKLARIRANTLALLMGQVYLCGHLGFVSFAHPHLLIAALSWQHPKLGCWAVQKPDPIPDLGIQMELDRLRGSRPDKSMSSQREEEQCSPHLSVVTGMAISAVYLRVLLDPGPWPEYALSDQLIQVDGVQAEDKFRQFRYLDWVRDFDPAADDGPVHRRFPIRRLPRPPPSSAGWSPDLLAFLGLLFLLLCFFVLCTHFCGDFNNDRPRSSANKKMYPYAFKKL